MPRTRLRPNPAQSVAPRHGPRARGVHTRPTPYRVSGIATRVREVSTALYRRYRPETFADVIGQEHVTEPLMQALRTGRVNHAYLFSGPRGCGKTTSARILARCLNCEQGPTPEPCGTCDSCVALARGGSGTVDVIEIDAASHGGVDDARDLRERASYGPAQSRYKIYIIDEAHMVTPQGFNALLKIVEEPPEHVKFVFATTEPEKVIGTIRSRTHHYPFRLVPPARLQAYMEELCAKEGVAVAPGVLSFVVRAGGGSVRDSLSVLDQLIAGSGPEGLTYESAAALLGFTDGELLDGAIDAFAAGDAGAVFRTIDKVVETGLDPRRFVEDLLERLRDLIVVAAVPDGAGPGAAARARGPARADAPPVGVLRAGGAVACGRRRQRRAHRDDGRHRPAPAARAHRRARAAPRCGRRGRVRRTAGPARASPRRRWGAVPGSGVCRCRAVRGARRPRGVRGVRTARTARTRAGGRLRARRGCRDRRRLPPARAGPRPPTPTSAPARSEGAPSRVPRRERTDDDRAPAGSPSPAVAEQPKGPGGLDTDALRRSWPDVLEWLSRHKRVTWTFVSQNAQVADYDGQRVLLGISTVGLAETFRRGAHADYVRQALIDVLGVDARVEGVPTDDAAAASRAAALPPAAPAASVTSTSPAPAERPADTPGDDEPPPPEPVDGRHPSDTVPPARPASAAPSTGGARPASAPSRGGVEPPSWSDAPPPPDTAPSWASPLERARAEVAEERHTEPVERVVDDTAVSDDDESLDDLTDVGVPVVERILGGTVISEDAR